MDPKDYKGTYKYDKDSRIQICVDKNPKREGCGGWKRFNLYKNGLKIRDFLANGGKTIDLDWDRERGFVAVEIIDEVGRAGKSVKSSNKNDDNELLDPPSIYLPLYRTLFLMNSDLAGASYFIYGLP